MTAHRLPAAIRRGGLRLLRCNATIPNNRPCRTRTIWLARGDAQASTPHTQRCTASRCALFHRSATQIPRFRPEARRLGLPVVPGERFRLQAHVLQVRFSTRGAQPTLASGRFVNAAAAAKPPASRNPPGRGGCVSGGVRGGSAQLLLWRSRGGGRCPPRVVSYDSACAAACRSLRHLTDRPTTPAAREGATRPNRATPTRRRTHAS